MKKIIELDYDDCIVLESLIDCKIETLETSLAQCANSELKNLIFDRLGKLHLILSKFYDCKLTND